MRQVKRRINMNQLHYGILKRGVIAWNDWRQDNSTIPDLEGANLRGFDLEGADLRGVILRGAYLRGANRRGAKLEGADLRGVNIQVARFWTDMTGIRI
jgi:hypothetical protein